MIHIYIHTVYMICKYAVYMTCTYIYAIYICVCVSHCQNSMSSSLKKHGFAFGGPYRYAWAGTYEERGTYLYVKKRRRKEEDRKQKKRKGRGRKRIGRKEKGSEEETKRKGRGKKNERKRKGKQERVCLWSSRGYFLNKWILLRYR